VKRQAKPNAVWQPSLSAVGCTGMACAEEDSDMKAEPQPLAQRKGGPRRSVALGEIADQLIIMSSRRNETKSRRVAPEKIDS